MTKLALSDEILMKIDKPARYIGNELNSIKKDKEKVRPTMKSHFKKFLFILHNQHSTS